MCVFVTSCADAAETTKLPATHNNSPLIRVAMIVPFLNVFRKGEFITEKYLDNLT